MGGSMSAEATISGMHTHVAKVGNGHWPAWVYDERHVIVDLRLFKRTEPGAAVASQEREFRPDELRKAGVPEETIQAAAQSEPIQGFCLMPRKRGN
jgi:hypothetical protein